MRRIEWAPGVLEDLREADPRLRSDVGYRLWLLQSLPFPEAGRRLKLVKLWGYEEEWRFRSGDSRVRFCFLEDGAIKVLYILYRPVAYR